MDWKRLVRLAEGGRMVVERVRLPEAGLAIEGEFELPPLAQLSLEDQVFMAAFVKSHGSIKEMERLFGVSYPTIKARLNRLSGELHPELTVAAGTGSESDPLEILDRVRRGEMSAQEAIEALRR